MLSRTLPRLASLALVRPPCASYAAGLVTHIDLPASTNHELAMTQWTSYVQAFKSHPAWEVHTLPPVDAPSADSHFVEDTAVAFRDEENGGNFMVVCRNMGAPERRPEVPTMAATISSLPSPSVVSGIGYIDGVGEYLDGGDVLKVGTTVYVGSTLRTTIAGIDKLRTLVAPLGYTVVAVPTTKVLHLKSAVTALPCGTVIGLEELVDDPEMFPKFKAMPEEAGSHVVVLDSKTLLMATSAPLSIAMLTALGYAVVAVDISEFEAFEGCVTCLSVRLRDAMPVLRACQ